MQKYKDNTLFDFLGFIFKTNNENPKDYKVPVFLVNRWISMANPAFAKIINLTTNKWNSSILDFDVSKFYRTLLPKFNRSISYIKKEGKEKEYEIDYNMASIMECSQREINLFNETLEELDINAK
jgi:hypothetical protein